MPTVAARSHASTTVLDRAAACRGGGHQVSPAAHRASTHGILAKRTTGCTAWKAPLPAGAFAVRASRPAARSPLALLQLLPGPADPAFPGHRLLGILDPADELVAGQRRDVPPGVECRRVRHQRQAQVAGKPVHHTTGHARAAHGTTVAGRGEPDRRRGSPATTGAARLPAPRRVILHAARPDREPGADHA